MSWNHFGGYNSKTRRENYEAFRGLIQDHHLIPGKFFDNPNHQHDLVVSLAREGLLRKNEGKNLMPLPNSEGALDSTRFVHLGHSTAHREYDAETKAVLDFIHSLNLPPKEAMALVDDMRFRQRQYLRNRFGDMDHSRGDFMRQTEGRSRSGLSAQLKLMGAELTSTDLTKSYSSTCGERGVTGNPLLEDCGPGGVAVPRGQIDAFLHAPELLLNPFVDVASLENVAPADDRILGAKLTDLAAAIWQEVSEAVLTDDAYPFFSLHFNDQKCLYPVLHPLYQHTVTGHVIATLDFFLKGFLNGGVYAPEFLASWASSQIVDASSERLRGHILDMRKLVPKGSGYVSLREALTRAGVDHLVRGDSKTNVSTQRTAQGSVTTTTTTTSPPRFRTAFRIIGKLPEVERQGSFIMGKGLFDVEYDIMTTPAYQHELDEHQKREGRYPDDFKMVHEVYQEAQDQVKHIMPKVAMFRPYFQLLDVVVMASTVVTSLRAAGAVPMFPPPSDSILSIAHMLTPKLFPPIPVRYFEVRKIQSSISDFLSHVRIEQCLAPLTEHELKNDGAASFVPSSLDKLCEKFLIESVERSVWDKELHSMMVKTLPGFLLPQLPPGTSMNDLEWEPICSRLEIFVRGAMERWVSFLLDEEVRQVSKSVVKEHDDREIERELNRILREAQEKGQIMRRIAHIRASWPPLLLRQLLPGLVEESRKMAEQNYQSQRKEIDSSFRDSLQTVMQRLDEQAREANDELDRKIRAVQYPYTVDYSQVQLSRNNISSQVSQKKEDARNSLAAEQRRLQSELSTEYQNKLRTLEDQVRKLLQQQVSEITNKICDAHEARVTHFTSFLTLAFGSESVSEKSHLCIAQLGILDVKFVKEKGEDVSIVGGCGVSLVNLNATKLSSLTQRDVETITKQLKPGNVSIVNQLGAANKHVICMRVPFTVGALTSSNEALDWRTRGHVPPVKMVNKLHALLSGMNNFQGDTQKAFEAMSTLYNGNSAALKSDIQLNVGVERQTALHIAAGAGNLAAVQALVRLGAEVNATDAVGMTALFYGILSNIHCCLVAAPIVAFLVQASANVNVQLGNGMTPLFLAAQGGCDATCKTLLNSAVVNVEMGPDSHMTPLHVAVCNQMDVVQALVQKGASPEKKRRCDDATPFLLAVTRRNLLLVRSFVAQNAAYLRQTLPGNRTVLHLAVDHNGIACPASTIAETATFLLSRCPDLTNVQDDNGQIPAAVALGGGLDGVAAMLLPSKGKEALDVAMLAAKLGLHQTVRSFVTRNLRVPDNLAVEMARAGMLAELEQVGAIRYETGRPQLGNWAKTLAMKDLMDIAVGGHRILLLSLLEGGSKVTPLQKFWLAVRADDPDLLMQQAAVLPPSELNAEIQRALTLAIQLSSMACMEELLKRSNHKDPVVLLGAALDSRNIAVWQAVVRVADPNTHLDKGRNALHVAVQKGLTHLIPVIASSGVSSIHLDDDGMSPLDFAAASDEPELISAIWSARTQIRDDEKVELDDNDGVLLANALCHAASEKAGASMQLLVKLYQKWWKNSEAAKHSRGLIAALNGLAQIRERCVWFNFTVLQDFYFAFPLDQTTVAAITGNGVTERLEKLLERCLVNDSQPEAERILSIIIEVAKKENHVELIGFLWQWSASAHTRIKSFVTHKLNTHNPAWLADMQKSTTAVVTALKQDNQTLLRTALAKLPNSGAQSQFGEEGHDLFTLMLHICPRTFSMAARIPQSFDVCRSNSKGIPVLAALLRLPAELTNDWLQALANQLGRDAVAQGLMCNPKGLMSVLELAAIKETGNMSLLAKYVAGSADEKTGEPVRATGTTDNFGATALHFLLTSPISNLPDIEDLLNHTASCGKEKVERKKPDALASNKYIKLVINACDSSGRSPLMRLAAVGGHASCARALIHAGADANVIDRLGNSALHYALMQDRKRAGKDLVRLLLSETSVFIRTKLINAEGLSCWMLAVKNGHIEAIRILAPLSHEGLQQVDNQGNTALMLAAQAGRDDLCVMLIDELNAQADFQSPGRAQIVSRFGKSKADEAPILPSFPKGETAMHAAAWSGAIPVLRVLHERGCRYESGDTALRTPLEALLESGRRDALGVFDNLQLDITPEKAGRWLCAAAASNEPGLVAGIVGRGASVCAVDRETFGCTALHNAAKHNSVAAATELIRLGASVTARDTVGRTPLHWAVLFGSAATLRLLLCVPDAYMAIDLAENNGAGESGTGRTALGIAAEKMDLTAVLLLLSRGASVEHKDSLGLTAAQRCVLTNGVNESVAACLVALERAGDRSLKDVSDPKLRTAARGLDHAKLQAYETHAVTVTQALKLRPEQPQPCGLLYYEPKVLDVEISVNTVLIKKLQTEMAAVLDCLNPAVAHWVKAFFAVPKGTTTPVPLEWELCKSVARFFVDVATPVADVLPPPHERLELSWVKGCGQHCALGLAAQLLSRNLKAHGALGARLVAPRLGSLEHISVAEVEQLVLASETKASHAACEQAIARLLRVEAPGAMDLHCFVRSVALKSQEASWGYAEAWALVAVRLSKLVGARPIIFLWTVVAPGAPLNDMIAIGQNLLEFALLDKLPDLGSFVRTVRNKMVTATMARSQERVDADLAQWISDLDGAVQTVSRLQEAAGGVDRKMRTREGLLERQTSKLQAPYIEPPGEKEWVPIFGSQKKAKREQENKARQDEYEAKRDEERRTEDERLARANDEYAALRNEEKKFLAELKTATSTRDALQNQIQSCQRQMDQATKQSLPIHILKQVIQDELNIRMRERFRDRSCDEVAQAFLQEVKNPIAEARVKRIATLFSVLEQEEATLEGTGESQICAQVCELGHTLGVRCRGEPRTEEDWQDACRLLALLRTLMKLVLRTKPFTTQCFAVLAMLSSKRGNPDLKGCIAQIRTGEGKSITTALLIAFLGVCGRTIDVITSNAYLAERDAKEFEDFFSRLLLTTAHICVAIPSPDLFDATIVYGTNTDFEFALLRRLLHWRGAAHRSLDGQPRPCDVVIVDEVDNLFLDTSTSPARLAVPGQVHLSWVYRPILALVQEKQNATLDEVRGALGQADGGRYVADVEAIADDVLTGWVSSAKAALQKVLKRDYIVIDEQVQIVDYENAGQIMEGSRWSNGVHEFVEAKEGLEPKSQSLTLASLAHPSFFAQYHTIFGVTGTMGSPKERVEVERIYQTATIEVPTRLPRLLKQDHPQLVENEYVNTLIANVHAVVTEGRPVLVLCISIAKSQQYAAALRSAGLKTQLLNAVQTEDETLVLLHAAEPGMVTVATNAAGRGTDIRLLPASIQAGGLHVIFTFLPANSRVEEQGFGRAGRQGQPGSGVLLLDKHGDERVYEYCALLFAMDFQPDAITPDVIFSSRDEDVNQQSEMRLVLNELEQERFRILSIFMASMEKYWNLDTESVISIVSKPPERRAPSPPFPQATYTRVLQQAVKALGAASNVSDVVLACRQAALSHLLDEWAIFFTGVADSARVRSAEEIQMRFLQWFEAHVPRASEEFLQSVASRCCHELANPVQG